MLDQECKNLNQATRYWYHLTLHAALVLFVNRNSMVTAMNQILKLQLLVVFSDILIQPADTTAERGMERGSFPPLPRRMSGWLITKPAPHRAFP